MKKFYPTPSGAFHLKNAFVFLHILKLRKQSLQKLVVLFFGYFFLTSFNNQVYADVDLTTSTLAAANLNQGTNNNIVYVAKMAVTISAVTVNNIQFTLGGTYDANDLPLVTIYFNATAATVAGSSFLGNTAATFAAPHTYSIAIAKAMAAGSSGYYIIVVNVASDANDANTIKVNGGTNPVIFGFSTSPTVTNNQTDVAGIQTIQAANITLTTATVTAANINQGSNNNIIYAAQMTVAAQPVTVSSIQFTLAGTHDADDLGLVSIYFNATTPTVSGASFLGNSNAAFAAPHTYTIAVSRTMVAGSTGYYIIVANVSSTATDNNTVKIDGAINPIVFGFTTVPNITNSQTDAAGIQTIQGADVTITSATIAASNIAQSTNNNIVYVAQMSVATEPVTVNNIQFTLDGTHNASDLGLVSIYFNATAPTVSGASFLGNTAAAFAAPHTYTIPISRTMAIGSTGFYIIVANVNSNAIDNNTIKVNGATNPVIFGFTTAPNVTNNQTDIAGTQTIKASGVTVTSANVTASNINQGTNSNIVYIAQMSVNTTPVTVNNIQFTLDGTHDADDLGLVSVYFNATAPTVSGASFLGNTLAAFAAPHTYSISISRTMATGSTGYYIIAVNINSDATDDNTIKVNGATNPAVFGFTTTPNVTNNQTNVAGIQTMQAADVTLSTSPVSSNTFAPGTNNNVVYVAQMSVVTEPVTVNNIQFTLNGTHIANDLTLASIYFNAAAPTVSGASFLGNIVSNFAAPHTYNVNISRTIAAGSGGYFIIVVNTSASAVIGNTIKIDGAASPVIFGFTTTPNIINNQTDNGGLHILPISFISVRAFEKSNGGVNIEWKVTNELNIDAYSVERSLDGRTFNSIGKTNATGSGVGISTYSLPDAQPFGGNNFYRISALNRDGKTELSPVVKISLNKGSKGISIYPNPVVKNRSLNLQFQNLSKGTYTVNIFNQQGQRVLNETIVHEGGNSVQPVLLPKIAAGLYSVEVRNAGTKYVNTIMVE
ncbi:MAG: T9SS type A sorting domain-containing protein [Ginsengibacter sp.]